LVIGLLINHIQDGLAIYIEDVDNNGVIEGQVVSKGKAKPI
jgi:hypothetical protein